MSNPVSDDPLQGELHRLTVEARQRNNKHIRLSLLIAAIIAVLAWKTQWPALEPGLFLLLAGQLAFAGFLVLRNRRLSENVTVDRWFEEEISAAKRAAWIENGPRMLGFAVLAFGFWRVTGNALVSVALGAIYPALLAWGLARLSLRTAKRLASQRERLHELSGRSK